MSFVHYSYVGHFDPRTVRPGNLACARPLSEKRVLWLLDSYPEAVASRVVLQNGYAKCQWAPGGQEVYEFAYRLAHEEGCVVVENAREVAYPPEAVRTQREEWQRLFGREDNQEASRQRAQVFAEEIQRRWSAR